MTTHIYRKLEKLFETNPFIELLFSDTYDKYKMIFEKKGKITPTRTNFLLIYVVILSYLITRSDDSFPKAEM